MLAYNCTNYTDGCRTIKCRRIGFFFNSTQIEIFSHILEFMCHGPRIIIILPNRIDIFRTRSYIPLMTIKYISYEKKIHRDESSTNLMRQIMRRGICEPILTKNDIDILLHICLKILVHSQMKSTYEKKKSKINHISNAIIQHSMNS